MTDKDPIASATMIHGDVTTDMFIGRDQHNHYGYSAEDVERLIEKVMSFLQAGASFVPCPDGGIEVEHNGERLQIAPDAGQRPERRHDEHAYLDFSSARRVAISTAPIGVTENLYRCKDWKSLIEILEQLPAQSDGSSPLLTFLKTFFGRLQYEKIEVKRKAEASVFIELRPVAHNQPNDETYLMRICSWDSTQSPEKQYRVEVDSIEGGINSFTEEIFGRVQNFAEQVGTEDELFVEFFLPYDKLNEPIEDWQVQAPIPMQLGAEYIVLTRSLSIIKEDAKKKWSQIKAWLTNPAKESFTLCDFDQCCSDRLHEELKDAGFHGVVFERLPDEKQKVMAHLVKSRVPIALWSRDEKLPAFIIEDWMNHPLNELPLLVKKLRRNAHKSRTKHPAIVLFWNNPERIPPSFTRIFGSP